MRTATRRAATRGALICGAFVAAVALLAPSSSRGEPIAVAFPLRAEPYENRTLFPFFKGLLPEGWYREVVCQTLKIDPKDDFGLLVKACGDCIGAVWIKP